MSKHIGIVACSAEGAALCYRTICAEAPAVCGTHNHPEITMHTHPLGTYMRYLENDDWQGVADLMLSSEAKLLKAGAEFAICPDNTIHQALNLVLQRATLPWLHIAGEVATVSHSKGYRKLGILGTKYLMEGPVYPEALTNYKIKTRVPSEPERRRINQIIFEELVNGHFNDEARSYFQAVIKGLKEQGCQAVVLGCTEIPLLISPQDSMLPVLDSTRILARAALKMAIRQ